MTASSERRVFFKSARRKDTQYPEGAYIPLVMGPYRSWVAIPEPYGQISIRDVYAATLGGHLGSLEDMLAKRSMKWFGREGITIDELFKPRADRFIAKEGRGNEWTKLELTRLLLLLLDGYRTAELANNNEYISLWPKNSPSDNVLDVMRNSYASELCQHAIVHNAFAKRRDDLAHPTSAAELRVLKKLMKEFPQLASSMIFKTTREGRDAKFVRFPIYSMLSPEVAYKVLDYLVYKRVTTRIDVLAVVKSLGSRATDPNNISIFVTRNISRKFKDIVGKEKLRQSQQANIFPREKRLYSSILSEGIASRIISKPRQTTGVLLAAEFKRHQGYITVHMRRQAERNIATYPFLKSESYVAAFLYPYYLPDTDALVRARQTADEFTHKGRRSKPAEDHPWRD